MAEYEPLPELAPDAERPKPSKSDSAWLALLERVDTVDALIARGYSDGQIRDVLRRNHGCSMGQGNTAIRLARLSQARRGGLTREQLRAQGNAMILETLKRATERKRPMAKGVGPGLQEIVYVDDPDGPTESKMVDAFLRFHALYQQEPQAASTVVLQANILQLISQQLGETVPAPESPVLDAVAEPGDGPKGIV